MQLNELNDSSEIFNVDYLIYVFMYVYIDCMMPNMKLMKLFLDFDWKNSQGDFYELFLLSLSVLINGIQWLQFKQFIFGCWFFLINLSILSVRNNRGLR